MVVATQVVFSLVLALTLTVIFSFFLRREGPRTGSFFFFLMLFLITLAGGLWVKPFGPSHFGIFWVPIILVAFFGGLFLYYSAPRRPPHNREETIELMQRVEKRKQLEQITYITIDLLFWVIVILLISAIVFHFFRTM